MPSLRRILRIFLCLSAKKGEIEEEMNWVRSATKGETDEEMNGVSYEDQDDDDDIQYLPEECITKIISFTSAACAATSMSLVSQLFKSVADSDLVWERFLPSDIDEIVAQWFFPPLAFLSKKELFIHLCLNPVLSQDGRKIFALEKHTGKKCYMIAARELCISWGEDSNNWWWIAQPGSRFSEVAGLLYVWWFDIRGRMETKLLSPRTTYAIFLVFKFTESSTGFGHVPVHVSIELQTGWFDSREIPWAPQERANQWMEIEIGQFFNEQGDDGWVEMRLWEVNTHKSGILIDGIELRPRETNSPFA